MTDSFRVGDRVVLYGLSKAPHLNNRHGHIGYATPNTHVISFVFVCIARLTLVLALLHL
jgi:hypothetical protein